MFSGETLFCSMMYCQFTRWGEEGRRPLRTLFVLCVLLAFCGVTTHIASAARADVDPVSATEAVVAEVEEASRQDEAAENRDESLEDAVSSPDALATALMQRIQELYQESFRLLASAKADATAFKEELAAHLENIKQGGLPTDPAQFRSLGGMQLSWMEADKSRKEASVAMEKLAVVLGQLKAVADEVGTTLKGSVEQAVRQGQKLYGSLLSTLMKDEKQSTKDQGIQIELRKGSI
ncbi:hypothetical protein TGPRC2_291630 [Toxoplasma gondii TgCatPRC2]|uniref:Uncharacterized protein n=6 Tax=Toxoplasma gondii TaxID=5811 RepID=B6KKZ2_TOXGV|nr:hypothetical protein TGME49_291630 [Toxoplasma gondii ME49]ESS34012.1 hypothetical protein TGVEG_291630 [Toxoplasma gondii VEG]KFH05879.1 hypothetical protein TGMAS_291630 [Toxoplasma gondii MAS]KYK69744.1 hypothetical protein TGPRC2_291630 [Toxoplasma gondii TgCatPRC2]PIL95847.1 hypothetical protein TGCOUG_291630 [Toxoplasma gondii COUG]PUA90374.1 hypothetical protein TGBR9_291630 [Toxoplasma gondii TgCATBr9]|eukprot:XP_002368515.1 hypothetical protein TGME49_291630 [Toxoplasma gondii ME49]